MSLWGYNSSLRYSIYILNILILKDCIDFIIPLYYKFKNKFKNRCIGWQRIGPDNSNILSVIFGSLLGDGHAERRKGGVGTRITFYQEASNK